MKLTGDKNSHIIGGSVTDAANRFAACSIKQEIQAEFENTDEYEMSDGGQGGETNSMCEEEGQLYTKSLTIRATDGLEYDMYMKTLMMSMVKNIENSKTKAIEKGKLRIQIHLVEDSFTIYSEHYKGTSEDEARIFKGIKLTCDNLQEQIKGLDAGMIQFTIMSQLNLAMGEWVDFTFDEKNAAQIPAEVSITLSMGYLCTMYQTYMKDNPTPFNIIKNIKNELQKMITTDEEAAKQDDNEIKATMRGGDKEHHENMFVKLINTNTFQVGMMKYMVEQEGELMALNVDVQASRKKWLKTNDKFKRTIEKSLTEIKDTITTSIGKAYHQVKEIAAKQQMNNQIMAVIVQKYLVDQGFDDLFPKEMVIRLEIQVNSLKRHVEEEKRKMCNIDERRESTEESGRGHRREKRRGSRTRSRSRDTDNRSPCSKKIRGSRTRTGESRWDGRQENSFGRGGSGYGHSSRGFFRGTRGGWRGF